jgi:hypothetical protein
MVGGGAGTLTVGGVMGTDSRLGGSCRGGGASCNKGGARRGRGLGFSSWQTLLPSAELSADSFTGTHSFGSARLIVTAMGSKAQHISTADKRFISSSCRFDLVRRKTFPRLEKANGHMENWLRR